jgi:hypothetical protein
MRDQRDRQHADYVATKTANLVVEGILRGIARMLKRG